VTSAIAKPAIPNLGLPSPEQFHESSLTFFIIENKRLIPLPPLSMEFKVHAWP
jgi:hypothetical protein